VQCASQSLSMESNQTLEGCFLPILEGLVQHAERWMACDANVRNEGDDRIVSVVRENVLLLAIQEDVVLREDIACVYDVMVRNGIIINKMEDFLCQLEKSNNQCAVAAFKVGALLQINQMNGEEVGFSVSKRTFGTSGVKPPFGVAGDYDLYYNGMFFRVRLPLPMLCAEYALEDFIPNCVTRIFISLNACNGNDKAKMLYRPQPVPVIIDATKLMDMLLSLDRVRRSKVVSVPMAAKML